MALAKIVYASMTGNTEACADIVADKLEELGFEVECDECSSVDASDLEDADLIAVGTYTYGDGELPDEIVDLYEDLADTDLTGKIFGCFGSGDTFYDDFCICIDMFEERMLMTGATKGADIVRVDLSPEDEDEEHLEAFAEQLATHFDL
ncbi:MULTISPECIES: flavodoxin [unclassified Lactococcus]|uniref:flavodoxin n=1 Tax=unclassified Lactococcus TaxID=2643510 RepID=UPI0011CBC074|nr:MULTISPECIES: flavodoxin [unclassified Lactococcus]MQW22393.1 flavodoxin [Lactococcus sp. dk101]TXK45428.1 flavodoxin [Lactococcus sp. dk310]TXK51761.1 flavodoxin [Lactococcus sp. dk322]